MVYSLSVCLEGVTKWVPSSGLLAVHRGSSNLWQGPRRLLRAGSRAAFKKNDSKWYTKSPKVLCDFCSTYTIYKRGLWPLGTSWRATGWRSIRYTNTISVLCCVSVRKCFLHHYSASDGMGEWMAAVWTGRVRYKLEAPGRRGRLWGMTVFVKFIGGYRTRGALGTVSVSYWPYWRNGSDRS